MPKRARYVHKYESPARACGKEFVIPPTGLIYLTDASGRKIKPFNVRNEEPLVELEARLEKHILEHSQDAAGASSGDTSKEYADGGDESEQTRRSDGSEHLLEPSTQADAMDSDEEIDVDHSDISRRLFVEAGLDDAAVEAACAAAAAASAPEAATEEPASAAEEPASAAEECASQVPQKRSRKGIKRFDPVLAERGGGGWGSYDLKRIGERHGKTRDQSYDELLAEARELREQMGSVATLINSPDRSFTAVMERLAAVLLHQAAFEEAGDDVGDGAGDDEEAECEGAGDGEAECEGAGDGEAECDCATGAAAVVAASSCHTSSSARSSSCLPPHHPHPQVRRQQIESARFQWCAAAQHVQ